MAIEEDTLRELKLLNQSMSALARAGGNFTRQTIRNDGARDVQEDHDPRKKARRGSREREHQDRAAGSYDSAGKKFLRATGNLTGDIAQSRDDFKAFRESFRDGALAMSDSNERIDRWGYSVVAMTSQASRVAAGMGRFDSILAKSAKAQSLLYSEQLKNIDRFKDFERAAYFDELTQSLGALNDQARKQLGLIDEATGEFRANLDIADFKKVRLTLGEVESSIKEVLSGTGFKSLMDLAVQGPDAFNAVTDGSGVAGPSSADINREALTKITALLESRGLYKPKDKSMSVLDENGNLKNAAALNKVNWGNLANQISQLEKSFATTNKVMDKNVDLFQNSWSRFIRSITNAEGRASALHSMRKMAADFLSSAAMFKLAKDKILKSYSEIVDFNVAQIPATYTEVNKAAVKMGMSFEDTVKMLDENKRILAIYGPDKFMKSMDVMGSTFKKYGYNMKQAADMVGPTIESAIASGVDIRDPGKLNTYTDLMMKNFQSISGIVKISAKEFAQLNKQLFQSEGAYDIMLGLDTQRRQAYAQDLVQLRARYVTQGLELQQAQELIQAQQQQQRGHLKDRTQDAAKAMALAQASGLGSQASMEIFNLSKKGRRTDEEQSRLTDLLGQLSQASETAINNGYGAGGAGAMGDILNELRLNLAPQGQLGQMAKAGGQIQMNKETGAVVSNDEALKAGQAAKGNEKVASVSESVNQATALINNSFVGAIAASIGSLGIFSFQLLKAARLMDATGGLRGGGPGAPGRGGAGGKLGKVGKGLLKGAGIGLVAAGAGMALDAGADALKDGAEEGSARKGAGIGASILSDTASGAGYGAALGSFIPGVGTLVGAGLGSAIGTGVGVVKNWKDIDKWWNTPAKEVEPPAPVKKPEVTPKEKTTEPVKTPSIPPVAIPPVAPPPPAMQVQPKQPKLPTVALAAAPAAAVATVMKPLATPVEKPIAGIPAPQTSNSVLNSSVGAPIAGINRKTEENQILGVRDEDAFEQLQSIATSLTNAVELLKQLNTTQQNAIAQTLLRQQQNPGPINATPTLSSDSIPSIYEFTTGRLSKT